MTPANEELFRQRATEYAVFLAAYGDEPRSTPDDPHKRRLAVVTREVVDGVAA